ncbi:MAG: type 1 glutamine amidotransferase domain-containing protein [Chloroflexi bacterium]|nr:type 1 glutamine amidotransferase domain-containing protein [Chloroflexota bacterium]
MNSRLLIGGGIILAVFVIIAILLPSILRIMGLHHHIETQNFDVSGKRALIITTSHTTLGEDGKATGVFPSEMTVPYYEFLDNGMEVDVISMQGGEIPMEPAGLRWPIISSWDKRYLEDEALLAMTHKSRSIEDVGFSSYDVIFFAGGWGAAYDLGQSEYLGEQVSIAHQNGAILGSVCHGALGFIQAVDENGNPIVEGKRVTAVTDKQVEELNITITPLHPETELRNLNALFESETAFLDIFATHVVVDGNLVTGQNQNSGQETAYEIMRLLSSKGE